MLDDEELPKIVDKINKQQPTRNLRPEISGKISNNNTTVKTDYDDVFSEHMENYTVETTALHRKLHSKTEAVRILRKELEKFRTERDQFKLMAETLQLRYAALTRNFCNENDFADVNSIEGRASVGKMLHGTRERNIKLSTELEALKQKLCDLQGDIEILRTRDSNKRKPQDFSNHMTASEFDQENGNGNENQLLEKFKIEKSNLITRLEQLKKKNIQLAFDLKAVLDEKEELINERDAYRCKAHRLNHELLVVLKANDAHQSFIDIDSIILENKYLHECLKNLENELDLCKNSTMKYKSLLDVKRKKSIMKLTQMANHDEDGILSHKQIAELLENGIVLPKNLETLKDFKSLILNILDNLNDKSEALNHQKKTNKILAEKNHELEKRLQAMMGNDNPSNENERFSIANYLLQGYNAALMDVRCENENNETNNLTCPNSEADSSPAHVALEYINSLNGTSMHSDEMTSLSSLTDRSILSSQYEITNATINQIKHFKEWSITTVQPNDVCFANLLDSEKLTNLNAEELINQNEHNKRNLILRDLPAELAGLVETILNELDADATYITKKEVSKEQFAIEGNKYDDNNHPNEWK